MGACRFCRRMAVQPGCSCRIFTFGKAPNGCGDCASWKRMNVVSGRGWAITITATPGKSRDMTAIETAAAPARRLEWQLAEGRGIVVETYRVKSLRLHVTEWQG